MARSPITQPRLTASARSVASRRYAIRNQPYSLFFGSGATDNINVPITTNPNTTDFTWMCWANNTKLPQPDFSIFRNHNLLSQSNLDGIGRSWLFVTFALAVQNRYQSFFNGATQDSTVMARRDSWDHVCITHSATTGVLKFYVNGVVVNTITGLTITTNAGSHIIGNDKNLASVFDGNITDIRFYEEVLTTEEVANSCFSNFTYESRMKYWLLGPDSNGSGGTVTDETGNGFDGTITGALWATLTPFKLPRQQVA